MHLWTADTEEFDLAALETEVADWLDEGERERYRRLIPQKAKQQFLLSRYLLQHTLSQYSSDWQPGQWKFDVNAYGKPSLSEQHGTELQFNLSHSGERVVIALGHQLDLGVDIEFSARPRRIKRIANRYFSPIEVSELLQLEEVSWQQRFYELWTLKEAYIKACGMGLAIPLQHFSYRFSTARRLILEFDKNRNDRPENWQIWQLQLPEDEQYQLAVACRGKRDRNVVSSMPGSMLQVHHFGPAGIRAKEVDIIRKL